MMKRNVRAKLDYGHFSENRKLYKMEQEITKRDKEYKSKWDQQQRHPKCKKTPHQNRGHKMLLKKKKINKWSTYHEKEFYIITGIHGSTITARRKSDGRTINRDASKFGFFYDVKNENWRERLLSSGCRDQLSTQNRQEHEEQREEDTGTEINNHQPRRQTRQQEETQKKELPKRTRRLPEKFKDYIVETAL